MQRGSIGLVTVVMVVGALLGACSAGTDGDAGSTTTIAGPAAGTTAAPGTEAPAATTGPNATTSTTAGTTTTAVPLPIIAPTPGTLALTRVVFGSDPYALVTNVGSTPVSLEGHWAISNNRTGSIEPVTLDPGSSAAIVLGGDQPPQFVGITAVIDLGTSLGPILASGGELGLFSTDVFTNPAAVVDYVAWGVGTHLNRPVATRAGIWSEDASVELPVESVSIASPGTVGGGVEDWIPVIGG